MAGSIWYDFNCRRTLVLAQELGDRAVEAQSCYSLGNTYTLLRDYPMAVEYHLRHLIIAQQLMDRVGEGMLQLNVVRDFSSAERLQTFLKSFPPLTVWHGFLPYSIYSFFFLCILNSCFTVLPFSFVYHTVGVLVRLLENWGFVSGRADICLLPSVWTGVHSVCIHWILVH